MASAGGIAIAYTQTETLDRVVAEARDWIDSDEGEVEYGEFHEISGMVINPADSEGRRYLAVDIGLEGDPEAIEEIEQHEVVVQDEINNVLSEYPASRLGDISQRDSIREHLRESVNEALLEHEVDRLYFTQYVLQ